jgi:SepF-like predicted cell division protein (DUF552 family)
MGILDKLLGGSSKDKKENVNLENLVAMEEIGDAVNPPAKMFVKKIVFRTEGDLEIIYEEIKSGNIILMDFEPVSKQSNRLKDIMDKLFSNIKSMGGDMAQLKNTTIVILTPNGIKIAKQK